LIAVSFPAPGSDANALAFGGTDLWITNNTADQIAQIDGKGQVDGNYNLPAPTPGGLAWDGCCG
jgi:hypothetical protein